MSSDLYVMAKLSPVLHTLSKMGCRYPNITVFADGSGNIEIHRDDPPAAKEFLAQALLHARNKDRRVYLVEKNVSFTVYFSQTDFIVVY